jgi:hypothetical protein
VLITKIGATARRSRAQHEGSRPMVSTSLLVLPAGTVAAPRGLKRRATAGDHRLATSARTRLTAAVAAGAAAPAVHTATDAARGAKAHNRFAAPRPMFDPDPDPPAS